MLRNDVPVGTGVTVEPLERATVRFETVTAPGIVTVTPLTEVAGEVPAKFQIQDVPIFFDVETSGAVFEGIVTVCLPYPDADEATLRLTAAGGGFDQTHVLDASGWTYVGPAGANKGYKYRSDSGPIRSVIVKSGVASLLKVTDKGTELVPSLATDPAPVSVELSFGSSSSCLRFGGDTRFKEGKSFKAKNAPAPAACDLP